VVTGYWVSQAICVAAKLGLADVLQDGPKSSEELARQLGQIRERCIDYCARWPVL
jgi:hypothetical protein